MPSARHLTAPIPLDRPERHGGPRNEGRGEIVPLRASPGGAGLALRRKVARLTGAAQVTAASSGWARSNRRLTPQQAWQLYTTTPDVRACIDSIVRRLATWDWYLSIVDLDKEDRRRPAVEQAVADATRFLQAPTLDGHTWQAVWTAVLTDLLVHDAGALELALRGRGRLEELAPLDGGYTVPVVRQDGTWVGYAYSPDGISDASTATLLLDEVLYLQLGSNTKSAEGIPLLETLLNEVVAILVASERVVLTLDADEVPPGLLVLGGLAKEAVAAAKLDLEAMRGRDHKARILYGAGAVDAKWLELRHQVKDIQMADLVREVRYTIWRLFGVSRVEMGETDKVPRAAAEVQVEVSGSHLITPILEQVQAALQARVLPYLIPEPLRPFVRFEFDLEVDQSGSERKDHADADALHVKTGTLTRNEVRQRMGYDPIPGGDVATFDEGGVVVPVAVLDRRLAEALAEPEPETEPGEVAPEPEPAPEPEGGEAPAVAEDAGPGEAEGDEDGEPAQAAASRCPCRHHRALDLPSEWPSASTFDGYRTLPLRALAGAVGLYDSRARSLWGEAQRSLLAALATVDPGDALQVARAQAAVTAEVDALHTRWSVETAGLYGEAAALARDAVREYTGAQVLANWRERADAYHQRAMGYLVDPDGLLTDLRARLLGALAATQAQAVALRSADPAADGARDAAAAAADGLAPAEALTAAASRAFTALEARVENWGGALVELASECFRDGLLETSASVEWWCEWVAVGDEQTCPECESEGGAGFRPLASLSFVPGSGMTACGKRCRCVLSVWTRQEVDLWRTNPNAEGAAVPLTGVGEPL